MFQLLLNFLNDVIIAPEPIKTIFVALAATIISCAFVIIVGYIIDRLERLEFKLITKISSEKKAIFIVERLTFPGTMLHELAHALFAWATGAKIKKVKLLTFFDAHRLGYINFQPTGKKSQQRIQMTLTSCAPVLMGFLEIHILILLLKTAVAPWEQVLLIYLIVSIINHMSMSEQDVKNYLRGLIAVFPILLLFFYATRLFL